MCYGALRGREIKFDVFNVSPGFFRLVGYNKN